MTETLGANTYSVVDLTGKAHIVHADILVYDEGMALFLNEDETVVAMFKSPISIVREAIDTIH